MEIYTNSANRTVSLTVPVTPSSSTLDVSVEHDGVSVHEFTTVTQTGNTLSVTFPFHLSQQDDVFKVRWKFPYVEDGVTYSFDQSTRVEVVTPYLTEQEIAGILDDDASADEIANVEKAVRHIINAHTGQNFGHGYDTRKVEGTFSDALALPQRLLYVEKVNGQAAANYFEVTGDGWYLKFYAWGIPPVKADYYGLHQHVGGVIHNPDAVKFGQFGATTYEIEGMWGWETVPAAVKEAAKLLVNDYACGDSQYRDRYLTSMTAADWRIQFHSGAFRETGNVRADQLLRNYVLKRGWAVI